MNSNEFSLSKLLIISIVLLTIGIISVKGIADYAKESVYDTQANLIINAAKKYLSVMGFLPELNMQKTVTLKELQDNSFLSNSIVNLKTGTSVSKTNSVLVSNNNGQYSYNYVVNN